MTQLRVLFCTDTYPPQVNGVSVVTALSVTGLGDRGWECGVIAPRYPSCLPDPFATAGTRRSSGHILATIASVPLPGYPDIRLAAPALGRVSSTVARFAPDLVHCETEFMIGRLGQIAASRVKVPLVSSYHTDFSRYAAEYGAPWLRAPVARYIGRFHRRSRRTYTPSEPARQDLLALGVREVEVWGRGVDVRMFTPSRRSGPLRDMYGTRDTFIFLHVGRLAAEKGVDRILAAYRLARAQLPAGSAHLVVAGAGPMEEELRAAAPEGVSFVGNLDRAQVLPRLYASCDAFVFASLTETLGLVILEAMASGLPVIACPEGGVADHLRDEDNGIACPARDVSAMAHAMTTLALDRARAAALARGALRTAEDLSWDAELDRLDASYRQLCESARVARSRPALRRLGALPASADHA